MTNFAQVTDYELVERRPGYDKINNPSGLNVAELTPIGVRWRCNGAPVVVQNSAGVGAVLLQDLSGVAIVEAPYGDCENKAYIVNSDGSVRVQVIPTSNIGSVIFYDVFYLGEVLIFLAASRNYDIQMQVDDVSGKIIRVKEFK